MAVVAAVCLLSCSHAAQRPACSPEYLAEIEAAYVAEAVAACRGQKVETCDALPEIRARYDALREEWVQCR
jgi:hypothetical protein